jgi:Tudor domain
VSKNDCVSVNVVHANNNNPNDFYVVDTRLISLFDKLNAEMNKLYKTNNKTTFVPRKGMLCAVKYVDKNWYRGTVTAVAKHQVEVLMVDKGLKVSVAAEDTRYLMNYFRPNQAAMLCTLHDVLPLRDEWTKEACDFFKCCTKMDNNMRMTIIEVIKEGGYKFSVALSVVQPTEDICINELLVSKGWGTSVGPESAVVSKKNGYQKYIFWPAVFA